MAKILVADDNSNVQKTVALALSDLGVEVVAVNNGDAAVKKLADVMPDLVLADIFMPVRNGYEVCEYIKKDSRFSHMPVVLLVGAFDPLDEREAQRVGADGILKKPFVPPDPLIAMVKTLLDRTLSERLVTATVSKSSVSAQGKSGGVAVAEGSPSSSSQTSEEPQEMEMRQPLDHLSFGEGDRPVAFSQLLDAPRMESSSAGTGVLEPVDDEQILTSSRDAQLGDPIFWKTEEPRAENETEDSKADTEDDSRELPISAWTLGVKDSSGHAESDSEVAVEPLVLVRDEQDEEAPQVSTLVEASPLRLQDAASQASLTVESGKADDLAANPIEWMASVSLPKDEQAPQEISESEPKDRIGENEAEVLKSASEPAEPEIPVDSVAPVSVGSETNSLTLSPEPTAAPLQPKIAAQTPETLKTQPSLKTITQSAEDTAHSLPKQEWGDLAASIQPTPVEPAAEKTKPELIAAVQSLTPGAANVQPASTNSLPPASKPSTQSAEETARSLPKLDWADLASGLQTRTSEPASEKPKSSSDSVAQTQIVSAAQNLAAPEPSALNASEIKAANLPGTSNISLAGIPSSSVPSENSSSPEAPDPALVEAVVQRVLEKMRPQVVDIITKEFLRPVVQALVHREITKR